MHRLQSLRGCLQRVEPHPARRLLVLGFLLRQHRQPRSLDVAARQVHRTWRGRHCSCGWRISKQHVPVGFLIRRLQALRKRRLPRSVSDRIDRAHGVRRRVHPAGRLQRLRLLRRGLPVRRGRPAARRWQGVQVHVLLRPAEGGSPTGLRYRLPDAVDSVRRARRLARTRGAAGPRAGGPRDHRRARLRSSGIKRRRYARDLHIARRT